jgi:hypothetical protein
MWNLIKMGGVPGMLFILLMGLTGVVTAFFFALRPSKRHLGFIKGMALATLFGTLAMTCADVGATCASASRGFGGEALGKDPKPQNEEEAFRYGIRIVVEGLGESTSPGVMGFALVGLTGMLLGVGRRRLDARSDVVAEWQ